MYLFILIDLSGKWYFDLHQFVNQVGDGFICVVVLLIFGQLNIKSLIHSLTHTIVR